MTDRELVARIARSAGQKAGYKQLVRELSLGGGRERRLLLEQLARLTVRGALAKLDREHWSIPRPLGAGGTRDNLAAGRLDLHRDGYGFVRPNARQAVGDGRHLHSSQRDQRRHAGRPGAGGGGAAQGRRPPHGPHRARAGAAQPDRRRRLSLRALRPRAGHTGRSLRRAHDAAHPHSRRAGASCRPRKPPRRIGCWAAKRRTPSTHDEPGRPGRRCGDHQLADADAAADRPRDRGAGRSRTTLASTWR